MRRYAILLLAALLGGCAAGPTTRYVAPPAETLNLSLPDARRTIRQTLLTYRTASHNNCSELDRILFTDSGIVISHKPTPREPSIHYEFYYTSLQPELILFGGDATLLLHVSPSTSPGRNAPNGLRAACFVQGDVTNDPLLRRLTDAVQVVKAAARPAVDFEAIARSYRAEAVKPALPESARRWRVQAESAVRAQQFDEAADLFDAALAEAPWWPEGHFNRALVLGEAGAPAGAITEMRRYLALVPEAPDARAAQDKIYEWERQVPAPALPAATPAAGK